MKVRERERVARLDGVLAAEIVGRRPEQRVPEVPPGVREEGRVEGAAPLGPHGRLEGSRVAGFQPSLHPRLGQRRRRDRRVGGELVGAPFT